MTTQDIRWIQRFQNYRKALAQLNEALDLLKKRELSPLETQGLIQAFENTHELAWNTLKDFLESKGVSNLYGSRDTTREAFAAGLLAEGDVWMQMIQSRNQTTHTYNEETMEQIAAAITGTYAKEFSKLQARLGELEAGEIGRSSGSQLLEVMELQRLNDTKPFMRIAGALNGPTDLSRRKGILL